MASELSSSERGSKWANLLPEILALIAKPLAALDYLNFSANQTEPETIVAAMASEISSSERGPDWANLLPEILVLIAKPLAALDYLNFSAVCTSWASIASPVHGMPPPLPLRKPHPFLLMRGDDGDQGDSVTILNIFDNPRRSYKIGQLPGIGGKWFFGSQFGWVAIVDELSNPSLLNPFTRARVELPPITTLPDLRPVYDSAGSLSGYFYPPGPETFPLELFRETFSFRKVVLSSDPTDGNFTAAAIFGLCELIFLRPGGKTWNYWHRFKHQVCDVMYREGKFLALTEHGVVYEIDPSDPSVNDRVVSTVDRLYSQMRYLVDSSGDLVHVFREIDDVPKTKEIEVRRFDPETGAWVPISSLGDCALFVGSSCSMSLPAGNGVKGSCVYFTDNYWDLIPADYAREMDRDMGVFDMSNMSFEDLHPPLPQLKWPPPIWITSPLL